MPQWRELTPDDDHELMRQRLARRGADVIAQEKAAGDVYFVLDPTLPASTGSATS